MAEIKDSGSEFHWSRPRIMGLIFAALTSPIFFVAAGFGHSDLGIVAWLVAAACLMIAYVRPTRFRRNMQRLIPTTAERAERANDDR